MIQQKYLERINFLVSYFDIFFYFVIQLKNSDKDFIE